MKFITALGQTFGLSTLASGRHFVCMSCYDRTKDTLTPLTEYEDGDHEPDGDSLCETCSDKANIQTRRGLERWVSLYPEEVKEVWDAARRAQ